MEYQIITDPITPGSEKLSLDDAELVMKYVLECERKGREARKKYQDDWEECDRLYRCEPKPIEDPELDWQTNEVLPWAYDAAESWHAYLHQTMMPKRDEVFTIDGRTKEDEPGAEAMQKYMEFKLDQARFQEFFGKVLRQLARQNHAVTKIYWKTEKQTAYVWESVDTPQPDGSYAQVTKKVPQERVVYNGFGFDVVQLDDFVFYPIHGDLEKTTRIHVTYKYLEDLKIESESGLTPYDKEALQKVAEDSEYKEAPNDKPLEAECKRKFQGVKLKEAWIHRLKMPDGRIYKNYVATIANDKHLIRFQKNPNEMGQSPFIFFALRPDGDCLYGYGLNSKGIGILNQASELFNQKMDEIKLRVHPPTAYIEDSINPYSIINRPGALIGMSQEAFVSGNLRPLMQDFTPVQVAMQEIAELKAEFETVTVPKVVKGMIETGTRTATEIQGAENNASGKMHADAFHINENWLKVSMMLAYSMLYQRLNEDPTLKQEMARLVVDSIEVITEGPEGPLPQPVEVTKTPEQLVEELPKFIPLPDVDIRVVGYQNAIRRQEQLMAAQGVISQLAPTPAAQFFKWDAIAEDACQLADLDKDRLIMDQKERQQASEKAQAQQEEQQSLLIEQEKAKLETERMKVENDFAIKQRELELKALEIELKYSLEQQKAAMEVERATNEQALRGAEIANQGYSQPDSGTEE